MEMSAKWKRKVVLSSELKTGDVFRVIDKPETVIGEVFKMQGIRRYRRLMQIKGECIFQEVNDLATKYFFLYEFKDREVELLGQHLPQNKEQQPFNL